MGGDPGTAQRLMRMRIFRQTGVDSSDAGDEWTPYRCVKAMDRATEPDKRDQDARSASSYLHPRGRAELPSPEGASAMQRTAALAGSIF